jgi:hypothetical protein
VLEASIIVCYDILLTIFMHEHFQCLVLCDKVVMKKYFSNRTCVFLYHAKCVVGIHICSFSSSQQ